MLTSCKLLISRRVEHRKTRASSDAAQPFIENLETTSATESVGEPHPTPSNGWVTDAVSGVSEMQPDLSCACTGPIPIRTEIKMSKVRRRASGNMFFTPKLFRQAGL